MGKYSPSQLILVWGKHLDGPFVNDVIQIFANINIWLKYCLAGPSLTSRPMVPNLQLFAYYELLNLTIGH